MEVLMSSSSQIISPELKSNLPYVYNNKSNVAQIFISFADCLIAMNEVVSLMFYVIEEDSNKLVLVEHRNLHQDFARNYSRIKRTIYLARNIINVNSVMELRDTDFSVATHKLGIIIDRGYIGIPIKDKDDELKAIGAILLWTSFINGFNKDRCKHIISLASSIYKSIERSDKIVEDNND
jgi:hypothetical protein